MPAIEPQQLQERVSQLVKASDDPQKFVQAYRALLEIYQDRTRRPGKTGVPGPLIPSFHVPSPVIRRAEKAVRTQIQAVPTAGLPLADELWRQDHLEFKTLALATLSCLPARYVGEVLARVQSWSAEVEEPLLVRNLLDEVFVPRHKDDTGLVFDQINRWLESPEPGDSQVGIQALTALVEYGAFENIPQIFQTLKILIEGLNADNRILLRDLARALARRTPNETVFFLRQSWIISKNPRMGWLIRQTLEVLDDENRQRLKAVLAE